MVYDSCYRPEIRNQRRSIYCNFLKITFKSVKTRKSFKNNNSTPRKISLGKWQFKYVPIYKQMLCICIRPLNKKHYCIQILFICTFIISILDCIRFSKTISKKYSFLKFHWRIIIFFFACSICSDIVGRVGVLIFK